MQTWMNISRLFLLRMGINQQPIESILKKKIIDKLLMLMSGLCKV